MAHPNPLKLIPGSWLLIRVTDSLHFMKKTVWWITIRIDEADRGTLSCTVAVRSGSMANEPIARYRKIYSAGPGSFFTWEGIDPGAVLSDDAGKTAGGSWMLNGFPRRCTVHEKLNRDGSVTEVHTIEMNRTPLPVTAIRRDRDGRTVISLELMKYGSPDERLPGGSKKFRLLPPTAPTRFP